jgi:hypothetical protein
MKPAFFYLLSIVVLLGVAWGCENNAQPVFVDEPLPAPTQPTPTKPTASTLPITNVASWTAITPPPLTKPNCRISRITTKEVGYSAPDPAPELIVVGRDTARVTRKQTEYFAYDTQGRVTRIDDDPVSPRWYTRFRYAPGAMYRERNGTINGEYRIVTDTIALNEQGYQRYPQEPAHVKPTTLSIEQLYDADGYFIGYKGQGVIGTTVENRNRVKTWQDYNSGGRITVSFYYDLSQLAIPNPLTYRGRSYPALNLETGYELHSKNDYYHLDGLLQTIRHYYRYDAYGRVVARVSQARANPANNFSTGPYGGDLQITYYEYECPQ